MKAASEVAFLDMHSTVASAAVDKGATVRALNDAFRRSFVGGQVLETPGVVELREAERIALLLSVRQFDRFDPNNDPYDEHDFGSVEIGGQLFFRKIDAYDRAMLGHSPNAADPSETVRVLTIMHADEY